MPSYLDFDTTKNFRDFVLSKTLNVQSGPQTFNSSNYQVSSLNSMSNIDLGDVDDNRKNDLSKPQTNNVFKPLEYSVVDSMVVIPRRANLSLYPYFQTNQNHSLVGILTTNEYENESELFKFAAHYIKDEKNGPIQSRISQNLYSATSGKVRLLDALEGNSATLVNIVTGKEPLIELNNQITVAATGIGKVIDFAQTIAGVEFPWTEIPGDYLTNPKNPISNVVNGVVDTIGNIIGFKNLDSVIKPSELFLSYMGSGQKKMLFENLSYSKYAPNYSEFNGILGLTMPLNNPYIGNDTTNNVKLTMSDGNGRIVRSSFYLNLLFDETATRLFERQKNVSDGGSIAGKLTWISNRSRNEIGLYNKEFQGESSSYNETLSTNYNFRDGSILSYTQEILNSLPTDSTAKSHVANVIDQTSRVFKEGESMLSKGSAIKYVNKFSQEESGVEYCRVWTKDRSYMNYSDTMKRTGLIRKYNSSVMTNPWNLNIYPVSNGNKGFDESTNMERFGDGFRAKKYMFSIENLAWKTSNKPEFTYEDLPYAERGPNGGRIMWFPPYGIKINENNDVKWEENAFIGRPEPVFTYQQTTRTANMDFKIIVDHPSIINLLTREHFKNMSDEEADNYINAVFAGCKDLDFYDLIKRYANLDTTDISMIKAYLDGSKDSQIIKTFRNKVDPMSDLTPTINRNTKESFESTLYFYNNSPISADTKLYTNYSYQQLFDVYNSENTKNSYKEMLNGGLNILTGATNWGTGCTNDYRILTGIENVKTKPNNTDLLNMVQKVNTVVDLGFNTLNDEYTSLVGKLNDLKIQIGNKTIKKITLTLNSSTSAVADDVYNVELSYRRTYSVIIDILDKLSEKGNINTAISKVKWQNTTIVNDKQPKVEFKDNNIVIPFKDLGYDTEGSVVIGLVVNNGEAVKNQIINNKNVSCGNENLPVTSPNLKITAPTAFWCRQTTVKVDYELNETIVGTKIPENKPKDEVTAQKESKPNIDVLKKIVMKVLGESYYFKKLEEESPVQFSSLKEKLRYFHPAFHSTTPEGLNSRLTFLHQCVRPGDTIPIKGISDVSDLNAINTSFGPPPVVIFRFGDFYHTKAIIRQYNITFDENLWDLNPEGIGVQPMIANVNISLSLIGGQGMENPVNELQNALSSNFYANTEVYDYRATATEDRTAFNKETLEKILNYQTFNIVQNTNDIQNSNKVSEGSFIGSYSSIGNSINYRNLINTLYNDNGNYFKTYDNGCGMLLEQYGSKISSMILSEKYRTINQYSVFTNTTPKTIKLLGNYKDGNDLFVLISNLSDIIMNKINTTNISNLYQFLLPENENKISEEIIKPFIKKILKDRIESLYKTPFKDIESVRNSLIITLDKLNFVAETEHDGYIVSNTDNTYLGKTLSGLTTEILYDGYSDVVNYIESKYNSIQTFFDDSLDFTNNKLLISDEQLKEFINIFLDEMVLQDIIKLYTKRSSTIFTKNRTDKFKQNMSQSMLMTKEINKNKSLEYKKWSLSVKDNLPTYTNKVPFVYSIIDEYVFSESEQNLLIKVNTTSKNKTTTYLNFYRS